MNGTYYFSETYIEARKKFKKATKKSKQNSYPVVDNLTIDTALYEKNKDTLVIFLSGVHGVEGHIGSAFQLYFIDQFLEKTNFSVAFIHALNPHGYHINRRYNENNVDLNRNCVKDFDYYSKFDPKSNKIIDASQELLAPKRPRKNTFYEYWNYYRILYTTILQMGLKDTIRAAAYGQNKYPDSVCYRGREEEQSTIIWKKYVKKITKGYKKAILVDLHTGTGKRFQFTSFTGHKHSSPEFKLLKTIDTSIKNMSETKNRGVDCPGRIGEHFTQISNAQKNSEMTIEFGTYGWSFTTVSLMYLSRMLVAENQIFHYGPIFKVEKIRKKFEKLYSPSEKNYQKFVLKKAKNFSEQLLKSL